MSVALYPGTFDPLTNGHLDLIIRASALANKLIIGVATNPDKKPLFSLEERIQLIHEILDSNFKDHSHIQVKGFSNLLIEFAKEQKANMIIRGLRAISDFEFEFQIGSINKRLDSTIETIYLMASEQHHFISSSFVKEIAKLKGDVSSFVTHNVEQALIRKYFMG